MTEGDERKDAVFEALWVRVTEAWDDEATHGAVLAHAAHAEKLPELAARYRAFKDDPARGPLATRRLDAIVIAAHSAMLSMKTPPRKRIPLSITLSAAGICALLLGYLTWVVWGGAR
jgi:hypothetical protein